ncbi:potassium voltage-gated channel subfamily A member 1-like [Ylistrum balloti]|uniref:potassium voltage-gated channel subfamily A member 1-like n=1 Tax=Ylistrum balloti TaxID=509963 RepID=UPI002905BCAE|nr:potassium voltage-gated channel subfamily A member 1-like [Ylistrum balloti]
MNLSVEDIDVSPPVFQLNISGKVFEVSGDILARFPNSRLGKLAADSSMSPTQGPGIKKTLFFSRPSTIFEDILAYYQTGELHMPANVCPKAYKRELEFWELDPDDMQYCCRFKYLAFFDEFETISAFQSSIEKTVYTAPANNPVPSPIGKFRARIWSVMEHEDSTVSSKIVMGFLVACVVVSILNLSLGTVDSLKQRINLDSLRSHLADLASQEGEDYQDIIDILDETNCVDTWECVLEEISVYIEEAEERNNTDNTYGDIEYSPDELKRTLDKFQNLTQHKVRHASLIVIDFVLLVIFFVELVVRLCSCPSFKRYFMSPLNVIDILVLVTAVVDVVIESWFAKYRYSDKGIKMLYYLQMLRVLRILRFVNKVPSIQVLGYTIRNNFTDLVVLLLYVLVGVVIFSNFAYFSEDSSTFTNMPDSWWWGIITMTTVGYGDVVPKTVFGKIMGCICALCGVLSLSLTVPVFVNTFILLYQISRIHNTYLKPKQNQISPTSITVKKSSGTTQLDTESDFTKMARLQPNRK